MLFQIKLKVKSYRLRGCQALDFLRRLGLPDKSAKVETGGSCSVDVSETFARTWFADGEVISQVEIDPDWLNAREATLCGKANRYLRIGKLSNARAEQLYIRGRFEGVCNEGGKR
jgi:hypothetical protein